MTDILDLPGWSVLSSSKIDGEYVIEAVFDTHPETCPKCGVVDVPYKHGVKPIKYRDSPMRGLPVVILAQVQRYKCKHCKETFLQPLAGIYPDMRMTQRCVEYIQAQCLRDTFVRIAEHIGCDDKTVRTVAGTHIADLNAQYRPWLPEWLGIDETQIDGQLRCIITDVVNRQGRGYSFEVLRARVLFGRKQPTMPINAEPMTRCASCNGLFTRLEIASHIRPKGVAYSAENAMVLCMTCHARFHTGGASHVLSLSPP